MEQPNYLAALEQYKKLDGPVKAHIDRRLAYEQAQGRNPLDWLQQTMTPKPRQWVPGSGSSIVRG